MDNELSSSAMQKLLGVNKVALNDLAKRGIAIRGVSAASIRVIEPLCFEHARQFRLSSEGSTLQQIKQSGCRSGHPLPRQ
jgi:hypothetical protein